MFISYPYFPVTTSLVPQPSFNPDHTRHRSSSSRYYREEPVTMHVLQHGHEHQVRVITAQRLREAMLAEQIRLAQGERQSRLATTLLTLRSSVGILLIRAGERLHHEAAPRPELNVKPSKATVTA